MSGHAGSFLAGVLEKAGIQPQVKRLGKYKSAGDQLARKDMSEAQKEQLTALLEDIYEHFTTTIASSVGKSKEEVHHSFHSQHYRFQLLNIRVESALRT